MYFTSVPELSLAHLTVLDVPPLELVSLAAKIGYTSIGLRLYPAFPSSPFYELPAGSAILREMQHRLQDAGIQVSDIEFIGIGENFDARKLVGLLDTASALGAQWLSVCGDDPDKARLTANFATLCDLAAPSGIQINLEYMAWRQVKNFDDALDVVLSAGRQNGGVLIDALHMFRTGGSCLDIRRAPPGVVNSIQLCDAVASPPANMEALIVEARSGRIQPGCGVLPLRELLAELPGGTRISLEVPTNGAVSLEHHARDIFESTQRLIASMRKE